MAAYIPHLVGVGTAALGVVIALPHTLLLSRYQNLTLMQQHGVEKELDQGLQELCDEVLDRYNLEPRMEENLTLYPSYTMDPVHKGSLQMRFGAIIGLPETYSYCEPADVERGGVTVFDQSVDWSTETGASLMSSLLLSRSAKKFAIAREICYVSTHHVTVQTLSSCMACLLAYSGAYMLNHSFGLKSRLKLWARLLMYGVIGSSVYYMHLMALDGYYFYRDLKTDKNTSKLGQEYAEGGVELYEKLLERNKALRELGGDTGKKTYSLYGNRNTLIRNYEAPIILRRDRMIENLKCYTGKQEEM